MTKKKPAAKTAAPKLPAPSRPAPPMPAVKPSKARQEQPEPKVTDAQVRVLPHGWVEVIPPTPDVEPIKGQSIEAVLLALILGELRAARKGGA